MKKTLLILPLLLLLGHSANAQARNRKKYINPAIETDSLNVPKDASTYYFPLSMFYISGKRNLNLSIHLDRWYSLMLYALHEPLLYNREEEKEVYRFTWLRRFRHPVSIRVEKGNESAKMYVKVSDGQGGAHPGHIIVNKVKNLTEEEWNTIKAKVNKSGFWTMSVEDINDTGEGAERILEGSTRDSYHFVTRSSPYEYRSMTFRECCEYLISLSEINDQQ